MTTPFRQRGLKWFEPTSPTKPFSDPFCRKILSGSRFPAFPASVRLAILVGDPSEPGPYVIRVKVPSGVKLMPHSHPEDRIYTVMSGVFYIGLGDQFDEEKLKAYSPG